MASTSYGTLEALAEAARPLGFDLHSFRDPNGRSYVMCGRCKELQPIGTDVYFAWAEHGKNDLLRLMTAFAKLHQVLHPTHGYPRIP